MVEHFRTTGIISKGIVYFLLGLLTFLAVCNIGGSMADKNSVITFIQNQIYGNLLVVLLGLGLLTYTLWRIYAFLFDGKDAGKDTAGVLKRIGYLLSGLSYGAFGYTCISTGIAYLESGGGSSKKEYLSKVLSWHYGTILLYIMAAVFIGVACYQFYKGYSKKFMTEVDDSINKDAHQIIGISGRIGHIARAFVFGIFAFFIYQVATSGDPQKLRGMQGVFSFIDSFPFGNILLGTMSLGLVAYGVYQVVFAFYSSAKK